MASARLVAVQRQIAIVNAIVTGAALSALTARVAQQELAKVQEGNRQRTGEPADYRRFVDGREGAALAEVKPGGIIVFRFSYLGEAADWIYRELVARSPVGPDAGGHYYADHLVLVDGTQIDVKADGAPIDIPPGAEVVFTDLRPYSRKIEQGESLQAPDGVYELTTRDAQRRFAKSAKVNFTYRGFEGGAALSGRKANRASNRYPSIELTAA